ncbi:MAG: tetratricopeptide repeat protein [Terracidiphilus sp.]
MMIGIRNRSLLWFSSAAFSLALLPAIHAQIVGAPAAPPAKPAAPAAANSLAASATPAPTEYERAKAYFHAAMAGADEEQAIDSGSMEYITRAIEEYKNALNADPNSPELNLALADLYYRVGKVGDAESAARGLLKTAPNNIKAHTLLGRIYLRQLSESQNSDSSTSPGGNPLDLAIAEYEKIVELQPKSVDDHMVLGQLYTVKHDSKRAEEQFNLARSINPDSEEVVLNLARLYAENGNIAQAAEVIKQVSPDHRTAKMEFALGAAYEQLKSPKDAIAAYQRAEELEPGDPRTIAAAAQALFEDNQLEEALKQYQNLFQADPENADAQVRISEILRRQGKYPQALAAVQKAVQIKPDSLEAGFNEGLLYDVLGRYDDAARVYQHMVDLTTHANGADTAEEKNNHGIFLDRLGNIYHEQNKVDDAIAAYQKMIEMGGDQALRGYQGEVDVYHDAKMFDKAIDITEKAVAADPKNTDLKLMLAPELADQGKTDQGLDMAKGLLTNTPKDRAVWLTLAQMYTRLHRWKDAEQALDSAEPLSTTKDDKINLLFLRGALAEGQKHDGPAEQYFRQVLALDPNNAMTLNYLGYMLADKGTRLPEALDLIRKAVKQDPMNYAYLDSLGWAYFKLGQYELAEQNLRQAVERDQTDPTVHDHLGDLYEKTGRIRLAAAQWQLSLAEFAKSLPADVEPSEVSKLQKKLESARVKLAREESILGPSKTGPQ